MIEILRNMARRKLRTGLTIFGIVIGIFALTVMGSMTEYFNGMIDNAIRQAGANVGVSPKSGDFTSMITDNDVKRIQRVPGVRYVVPMVIDLLQEVGAVQMGTPDLMYGMPPDLVQEALPFITIKNGRTLQKGDEYAAVIGTKIASNRHLELGGTVRYKDHDFTVVGILAETQTSPDSMVFIPLDVMRRLIKAPDLIMGLTVVPADPADAEALATRISAAVDDLTVSSPEKSIDSARQALAIFNAILLSGAFLAVIVGGVAVVNTMVMSVTERTAEIGLKKAIGATDWDIVREYVTEASMMGLLGGTIGVLLGAGLASLLNAAVGQALGSSDLFTVTPRLIVIAMVFAVFLGTGAGVIPAWNAARLDPMRALRAK